MTTITCYLCGGFVAGIDNGKDETVHIKHPSPDGCIVELRERIKKLEAKRR